MANFPSKQLDQFTVRFPDGLRDRIKDAAAANNRSMNAEIVARLEASLNQEARDPTQKFEEALDAFINKLVDKGWHPPPSDD